jgi:hypothetical protein
MVQKSNDGVYTHALLPQSLPSRAPLKKAELPKAAERLEMGFS